MAPLAADRNTPMKYCEEISVPVGAAKKIFAGSLVAADATGFATPGATATTLTYLGRAEETVDNSSGANAAKSVRVRRRQSFKFKNSGTDAVVQADLGKVCYIEDDQTVSHTAAGKSIAGKVLGIDPDGVWVE
jgi:hypothetical protein